MRCSVYTCASLLVDKYMFILLGMVCLKVLSLALAVNLICRSIWRDGFSVINITLCEW